MSGQDIYDNFTGSSLMTLVDGADSVTRIAASYENRASFLQGMLIELTRNWDSSAGAAARGAAQPLTNEHVIAAPEIHKAASSMQQQAEVFESARNAVVPIPPMPRKPGLWENFIFGEAGADARYELQLARHEAANEHNIAVMRAYEKATEHNQAMLTPIPQVLNPTPDPGTPPAPPSPGPQPLPWRVPRGGGGSGNGGTMPSAPQPNAQTPASPPPLPGHPAPGETHADSAQALPPRATQVDVTLPKPAPPGPTPAGPGLPFGPLGGGSGSGADPGRAGARGFGPGGPGSRGEAGAHAGGRGGGLGARGPENALGRGAAGGAGRPGGGPGGGAPIGGGGRSSGEEDLERQRPSFLVDPDPDETFGTDEVTAPPVIGG